MKLKGDTGEEVQDGDVYREFNEEIARKYRIQSFKAKVRFRLNCFTCVLLLDQLIASQCNA